MQIPLQISFRNMDPSPAVEAIIREKAAKLDRFFERIVSCDVTIEAPHRHHHKGKLYKVRIDIGMPGKDVHVNQEGPKNQAHEDVYVAIRDASTPRCASSKIMRGSSEATSNPMALAASGVRSPSEEEPSMKVKDMMHKGVECVSPDTTIDAVAKKMRELDVRRHSGRRQRQSRRHDY